MKRTRTSNYSENEITALLRLCNKYSSVLENKKTDAVTNNEKLETWNEIEKAFNKDGLVTYRKKESLQLKYESIKKNLRKSVATDKAYTSGTGGGPYKASKPLTPEEDALMQSIKLSAQGVPNWYGTDNNASTTLDEEYEQVILETEDLQTVVPNWGAYSAQMLQTRKHSALQRERGNEYAITTVLPDTEGNTSEQTQSTIIIEAGGRNDSQQTRTFVRNVDNVPVHVETLTVENVIKKKKVGHKMNKSKPFEDLAICKRELVEEELEIARLRKAHLQKIQDQESAQKEEEHLWKKQKWELEMQVLRKKLNMP